MSGNLKGSLRNILDRTMEQKKDISEEEKNHLSRMFLGTLRKLLNALGKDFIILAGAKRPSITVAIT